MDKQNSLIEKPFPFLHILRASAEDLEIRVIGSLGMDQVEQFLKWGMGFLERFPEVKTVVVDMVELKHLDTAGALALVELERVLNERGKRVSFRGGEEKVRNVLSLVSPNYLTAKPLKGENDRLFLLDRVGEGFLLLLKDAYDILTFVGELLVGLGRVITNPREVRWNDVLFYMKRVGGDALPIVGLLSMLVGVIMAFMSSLQLKQFGANIYVAKLVGLAIVKELGPMMTAIIVAGRSGSAFAAEIGTMRVNEETDALFTMGFEPVFFLAIPKVLASLFVVPLLALYAMMFGILGGLVVGVVGLELTFYTYFQQTMESITTFDILASFVKSVVFSLLIAGIGCQRGFKVQGGAEAVGAATTSAVVSAIFLVVVTDSSFAVLLHYVR
ncbi:MAG: MlaE family lipid ABC transporter permease subunit [Syntrophales bacterium]|nr:MlaE family lipid ABC transporter permease subunit [Syntrophales bacterium]